MNPIHRDLFQAIHEGKWLTIEYQNKKDQKTRYWIGIRDLNPVRRTLAVDGLHLGQYTQDRYDVIYIDSILSSQVLEGTWQPVNQRLVQDIAVHPHKYQALFDQAANLKILNYLEDCNRMDTTPYRMDFALVKYLDRESFRGGVCQLSDEQFGAIVRDFQVKAEKKERGERVRPVMQLLAMNVLSLHTPKGLYVLAYRKLYLDVKEKCMRPDGHITVCTEFTINGERESIRRFLDGEDYELLEDFEKNQEAVKDALTRAMNGRSFGVDDVPYVIGLGMDVSLDLHKEYGGILKMFQEDAATVPIRAFFGQLLNRPRSGRTLPIALMNRKVNLDQLLAIHNAMQYPLAYIQGPPGTGKTNTILNTIVTAFFNEKTVLFASYNNHPIDGVCEKLSSLTYRGRPILFPIIRLGNQEKMKEALKRIRYAYEEAAKIPIFSSTLERNKDDRIQRTRRLSQLLKQYDEVLELKERRETIRRLLDYDERQGLSPQRLPFEADLRGRQLRRVETQIEKAGEITNEAALSLLADDQEELKKYLYYTSASYMKRLDEPRFEQLKEIVYLGDSDQQLQAFGEYLSQKENLSCFQRLFPVIATTCISAHRLGPPECLFDMTIMDEASQCNTAVALVPVLRGKKLMLVGDPQQLNPVILLGEGDNEKLMKKYGISPEYDYRKNSIYKTFLACDAVSDEVLLRYHYRCSPKIIDFNNQKYYHSRLKICTESGQEQPLVYVDVTDDRTEQKNTAPGEIEQIVRYAEAHKDKTIGVITPFVNQKNAIEKRLKEEGLDQVVCGTVHAFQGDEKDVILFSTAITGQTGEGTYGWLKNNRELINVAVSRAREQLIVLSNTRNLERLHRQEEEDDFYDLVQYVRTNGTSRVTPRNTASRALGIKPYSTATEEAFLTTLNHALDNLWLSQNRFSVEKEVAVSQVFEDNLSCSDLFYTGRFDFVVYERNSQRKYPVLVIELDGREHYGNEIVMARDRKKEEICRAHDMELIRVENSYARRYQHIKRILEAYFAAAR